MNIREQLKAELSKFNMEYIAGSLGTDPDHFHVLMDYVLNENDPIPPRAAWVAELMTQKDPELIIPWIEKLIHALEKFTHPGTRRNILKILARTEIPEEQQGFLLDTCFRWLNDDEIKVATKVFSMDIIENHISLYPELANELSEIIYHQWDKNSAGFKSRGGKVLKRIEKYL